MLIKRLHIAIFLTNLQAKLSTTTAREIFMAKSAPAESRFRIPVECNAASLGTVMVALAQIDHLTVMGAELITDVVTFKKNKPRKKDPAPKTRKQNPRKEFKNNAQDVILAHARRNHGKFGTDGLIGVFKKQGRARNSIYATLDSMLKTKMVQRTGKGTYVLLAKGMKSKTNGAEAPHG
jgi:hypothetical protein